MANWHTKIENINGRVYVDSGNRNNSYLGKFWVAKIENTDPKFGFKRVFINDKDGALLDIGVIYQVHRSCQWGRPEDYFIQPQEGGDYEILSKKDVLQHFLKI
jgi:hypothetical protein